jgi:SWI/SNF-related matrix-associated actin-dependent regulator 1 of chromatin subfamily A
MSKADTILGLPNHTRPFRIVRDLPEELIEIPGVWKNKHKPGFRVPLNALTVLGWSAQESFVAEATVEAALSGHWIRGDLREFAKEHQKRMLLRALALPGSHSWAPPGAGKTLVGLVYAATVASPGAKLIITKAAARGTWMEQCERYTLLEPTLLLGQTAQSIKPDPSKLYITAWETLKYWREALVALRPGVVVWDEIHWLRQPKHTRATVRPDGSIRFDGLGNSLDAARQISAASDWKLGLTATPIPGRVRDLWTQLDLVEPWQWGSFHQFGLRYCGGQHNGYGYEYRSLTNPLELKERLSHIKVRVKREEVNKHLPKKRREIVRLSVEQQNTPAPMKRLISKATKALKSSTNKAEARDSYFEILLMEAASRKHKYIEDRVLTALRSDQKVVVFTGRRVDCERLADRLQPFLTMRVPSAQVWWAHGGTDPSERDRIRNEYMSSLGPSLLIGTGDAWGESIDLQDTDLALITMLPWTPDKVIQWEGRFSRLGQKRPVLVSYVIARTTADEHVADLLLDKLPHVGEIAEDAAAEEIEGALGGVDTSEGAEERLLERITSGIS